MKAIFGFFIKTLFLFPMLFLIWVNTLHTQDFEFIVQHEGTALAIANYGDHTYFGSGGNISVLETGLNDEFSLIYRFYSGENYSKSITIDSDIMFVATTGGLQIYSIANPELPELMNTLSFIGDTPDYTIASDSLLVIFCDGDACLYNIANPFEPVHLSSIYHDGDYMNTGSEINNEMLYGFFQDGYSGPQFLVGYDISDPTNPVFSVSLQLSPNYQGPWPDAMLVKDDHLFVGFNDTLKMYDISNVDTIKYLTQFAVGGEIAVIGMDETYAYVDVIGTGVTIYNLYDFFNPELLGTYYNPDQVYQFDVNNEYIFCGLGYKGIEIADKSDLQNIQEVYEYKATDGIHAVHIRDNLAYFGMNASGLQIVDINDVLEPLDYGNLEDLKYIRCIESIPGYIYCSQDVDSIIHIVDVSDNMNPQKLGELLSVDAVFNDYCIDEDKLFLLEDSEYIKWYDLSIPESPALMASHNEEGRLLAVKESFVVQAEYIGSNPADCIVKLLKIENGNGLSLQDQMIIGESPDYNFRKIEIDLPYVFVCIKNGLVVLKINENNTISLCDEIKWSHAASSMTEMFYDDEYIYLCGNFNQEYLTGIIDKNDLYNLSVSQFIPYAFSSVATKGDYLFGAYGINGYYVYGDDITGVEDLESVENEFSIACNPNPCYSSTTISFITQKNTKTSLAIYNLSGQRVFVSDVTNKSNIVIGTQSYKAGIYLCKISSLEKSAILKLIVQR